jgi:hypothetical protein
MQNGVPAGTSNESISNWMLAATIEIVVPHSAVPPLGAGEGHVGVPGAAELGALAGVCALLGDRELELVRISRVPEVDDVALDEELGHVERVVDVERLQDEPHGLPHGHRHRRRLPGGAADRGALLVVEGPLPLEALDLDRRAWLIGTRIHLAQRDHAEREEDQDDDGRDGGPDDLDRRVAVKLLGEHVVARLAPVARDGVEDEALDADKDDERQAEDQQVEVEDVLPRLGVRLRREHAAGKQREEQDASSGASDDAQ